MTTGLDVSSRCPKCGTKTLEKDPEGDIHCWGCGATFMQEQLVALAATSELAAPIATFLETAGTQVDEPCVAEDPPAQVAEVQPIYCPHKHRGRGRLPGEKVGHYRKTSEKASEVVRLYNLGYGIRSVAKELSLAPNSVKVILKENAVSIDHSVAEISRKAIIKTRKQTIILALKGLASSAKSNGYSYEAMFERAENMLASFIQSDVVATIQALVGDKPFTIDDLFKRAYEIVLGQRLRLDSDFTEVEPGVFRLKGNRDVTSDRQ